MDIFLMIAAIVLGSSISLLGGSLIFTTKKRREQAILIAMPFGAGALLAAAFFDLLPEAFELSDPRELLLWVLSGFMFFFLLERSASWFHHHHEHDEQAKNVTQRRLIVFGDLMHNAIDGMAIGASFLVSPALGFITTLAVSAHEIPKELGTFALLLSRGWRDKTVIVANILTALATIAAAVTVYVLGSDEYLPVAPLLAVTAGFFIYIAASDVIPDIHEQKRKVGTIQSVALIVGIVIVGTLVTTLHQIGAHSHDGVESTGVHREGEHLEDADKH